MVNHEGEPLTLRNFIARKRTIIFLRDRREAYLGNIWKIYEYGQYDKPDFFLVPK